MIELQGLRYWYPGAKEPTLRGVDLSVRAGELVLLTGRSGCGKTTFLHCLKGLIPKLYGGKLEGRLWIDGQDAAGLSVAQLSQRVGLVMQDPDTQLCNLFVTDEVAFGVENLLLPLEQCQRQVDRALLEAALSDLRRRQVYQLSGGQKQRVAIASVLAMDTPLILLDEPTANLDARAGQEVFALIDRLRADGRTILLVQHELDEVIDRADKLLILDQGQAVEFGSPRAILARYGERLTEQFGIGLPQVALAALRTGRRDLLERLPLSAEEFATAVGSPTTVGAPAAAQAPGRLDPSVAPNVAAMIEARNLSYSYAGATEPAVADLSLRIGAGEVVAIIGKNGSGKSTLARLLVGLLRPGAGEVRLDGRNIRRLKPHEVHQSAGYVFQYPEHQFLAETVVKEIAYGLEVKQRPAAEIEAITADAMRLLKLEALAARHPFSLSGGEKRRLSVATMIVLKPRLLILDEPTYGLDEGNLANLVDFIFARLREAGITVVFITHDMRLVAEQAQRALVMANSRLVFDGTPAQLFADTGLMDRAELALPPAVRLAGRLRQDGWNIPLETITLDDFSRQWAVESEQKAQAT